MSSADDSKVEAHGGSHAAWALRAHGVDALFTLSGGHIFPLYDGCVKEEIRLVDVRHEQTAVFAAEGYAKVSRRPGVAALTAGPGVTNGVSAITTAHFTGSPVAVLGGRAPAARWGHGSLQELDHVPILETVTKHAATSGTTAGIGSDIDQMLRSARSSHRGPTFLDVPMDLFFGSAEAAKVSEFQDAESAAAPDAESLEHIGQLLSQAERPVLMAGADVYWDGAEGELKALAEAGQLPVFMNGLGRGTLAADHALAFSRCRSTAFKGGDLVVVIGTPLDFRLGFGRFGDAKVVHIMDRADRVSQHVELAASAGGSLSAALRGVREALSGTGENHSAWIETLTAEETAKRDGEAEILGSDADPIHPGRIYGELAKRLDRDAVVIGDGGDFVSYAGKYVDTFTPGCFLDPGPYGCLGTGPGYALGAHTAAPDRQVVLLMGDGAAGFSLGDLDTLVRFQVPVAIVVGNNVCWGLEKHPMQHLYGYHVAAELSEKARYDGVLEALGGAGETVERPGDIGAALERALDAKGPYLVNVMTDPENVYPRSSNLG
ncbi:MAG: acetolactate synthase [Acidobacteriota bacterium]